MTEPRQPIVLTQVSKAYGKPPSPAVKHVSLRIEPGEFFCIVGPSGCGKSTIIKLIAGIEQPTRGRVDRPSRIGMVFQSYALLPWLTVESNVAFAARMRGFDKQKVAAVTDRYLRMVHLEKLRKRYPRELSGGQRQRVGLARALATEPDVLLMDEPFSALDPVMVDELHEDVLRIWSETGTTIVMVSHHFDEAVLLADRIAVVNAGVLRCIVEVPLARPRRDDDPAFLDEVRRLRDLVRTEGRSEERRAG